MKICRTNRRQDVMNVGQNVAPSVILAYSALIYYIPVTRTMPSYCAQSRPLFCAPHYEYIYIYVTYICMYMQYARYVYDTQKKLSVFQYFFSFYYLQYISLVGTGSTYMYVGGDCKDTPPPPQLDWGISALNVWH